ncbi:MAG TPA: transposase zinc-binding domain-containing protein [Nitrososphaera sp.]|nr:transposase zinc-binding domain-containing protein [Nitrososphaera sp.]
MAITSKATVQQLLWQMPGCKQMTSPGSHAVLSRIEQCRTAALGYHAYRCHDSDCGAMQYVYHSCRNRHCPACGNNKTEQWIEARMKELLPVKYYHVVFTIPHQLNSLVLGNRKAMFNLLFDAASYTLLKFAGNEKYLGAQPGIIAVLHTWGQQLSFHPHIHSIVSGGGIDDNKHWKDAGKAKHKFLFPTKAVQLVYRAYFLKQLQQHIDKGIITMTEQQHKESGLRCAPHCIAWSGLSTLKSRWVVRHRWSNTWEDTRIR